MGNRPANTAGKAVSSPGKGSKRTDLSPSRGPIRIAGGKGVAYGSGVQQHQLQAARQDAPGAGSVGAPTGPSSAPVAPPAGSTGLDPRSMLGMIGKAPTAFPGDPIGQTAPAPEPPRMSRFLRDLASQFPGSEFEALAAVAEAEERF